MRDCRLQCIEAIIERQARCFRSGTATASSSIDKTVQRRFSRPWTRPWRRARIFFLRTVFGLSPYF